MAQFIQLLANGIAKGSYYALIALGYTMVYGIIQLINFAHGDIFMLGAFVGLWVFNFGATNLGFHAGSIPTLIVILLVPALAMPLVGVSLERFAYRPLRNAPRLAPLITALGASIVLEQLVAVFYTKGPVPYPAKLFPDHTFHVFGASIRLLYFFMVVLSLGLMFLLSTFVRATRLGKAMRATAEDRDTARLMGINVDQIIALTFVIGSALAGVGGVMRGMYLGQIDFFMGFIGGLKAFTAAVLGGIGNITGAVLGGFVIGFIENFASSIGQSRWSEFLVFMILTFVLIFKPSGLFGQATGDRA